VVVGPPYVPERGFAAAAVGAAAVAGPGFGSGDRRRPRKAVAAADVAVGLPHQKLGEWCYGAKFVKSVKVMAG
jgi:hypothetical protein